MLCRAPPWQLGPQKSLIGLVSDRPQSNPTILNSRSATKRTNLPGLGHCQPPNHKQWSLALNATPPHILAQATALTPHWCCGCPKTPRPHLPWPKAASSFIFIISPEPSTHLVAVFCYFLLSSFRLLPPSCAYPSQHLVARIWLFFVSSLEFL